MIIIHSPFLFYHLCGSSLQRIGDWRELIDAGDPQSGNWFRFRFVLVSCVRASWRGEAVRACERGVFVNAEGLHSNISVCCSGRGFPFCVFHAICKGFKEKAQILLLCLWAFWSFLVFYGMLMGFLMLLHTLFAFAAVFIAFWSFLVFDGMLMGFADVFCKQQMITTDSFNSRSQQIIATADLSG